MYSKLVQLSTTNFLLKRKTTSTELVAQVVLVERESPLTLYYQMTQSSSEKSRTITTLKLKKCLMILRILTLQLSEERISVLSDRPDCVFRSCTFAWNSTDQDFIWLIFKSIVPTDSKFFQINSHYLPVNLILLFSAMEASKI